MHEYDHLKKRALGIMGDQDIEMTLEGTTGAATGYSPGDGLGSNSNTQRPYMEGPDEESKGGHLLETDPEGSYAEEFGDLHPIAILMDELKHAELTIRLNAIKNLGTIAIALGPERTRTELMLFLKGTMDPQGKASLALGGRHALVGHADANLADRVRHGGRGRAVDDAGRGTRHARRCH